MQAWLKPAARAAIGFYQVVLRPLNPWGCKFYPSCSNYALEAIERHGAKRGVWLALKRLARCRPGVFGGFDPVPEPGEPEMTTGTELAAGPTS
jgi:putative membrane protein insertion efficiency factor